MPRHHSAIATIRPIPVILLVLVMVTCANPVMSTTVEHNQYNTDQCAECHQQHGRISTERSALAKTPYHQGYDCTDCHDVNNRTTPNLSHIPETLLTPNNGVQPVLFTARSGANSFADGDGVYDGVCEVCHTTASYHRNNSSGDHTHNVAGTCVECHSHADGFAAQSCTDCHQTAQGTGGYRRQVVENLGDGGGDFILAAHHVTNGTTTEVVTNADCTSCHDMSQHQTFTDGVSVLLKDPAGGAAVLYDGTASSVESWCVSCHDGVRTPFSDGRTAPDQTSWNGAMHGTSTASCLDCHGNGHGSTNRAMVTTPLTTPNSGSVTVVFNNATGDKSFADGDGIHDGICEVCHTTTTYHRNDGTGTPDHNTASDCSACHVHNDGFQPTAVGCFSCHNAPQGAGDYRRQIVENAGDGNGDFVLTSHHVSDGSTTEVVTEADCEVCHDQTNHKTYSDGVSVLLKDPAGGAAILFDGANASLEAFCIACHDGAHPAPFSDGNPAPDHSTWDGNVHGPAGKTCADCHGNGHGSSNISLIRNQIVTPNSGVRTVVLTGYTGTNSLADGDGIYDGICEACHTTTTYHRNNSSGDHAHNTATDCRSCHTHDTGYAGGGSCLDCHNTVQGVNRRQVVENASDGNGDFVRTSHHVTNGTTNEVVAEEDCLVCHDQSNHQSYADGVSVYLNQPAGGAAIVYDGSTGSLTAFCQDCHDGSVSGTPFSDGRTPPNNLVTWSASAHGAGAECADCHSNGHGGDRQNMLTGTYVVTDNNGYASGDYALCWNCHSANTIVSGFNSFEDLHNLHVIGEQSPCIICHDPHGGTNGAEPGMISFEYGISIGMDIQYIDGYNASTAYWVNSNLGFCYISCHGKDHTPKDYNRTAKIPLQDVTSHVAGAGIFAGIATFPSPSSGPVTIIAQINPAVGRPQKSFSELAVTAAIYDLAGRKLRTLSLDNSGTTEITIRWDGLDTYGRPVNSGVYFCRIATNEGGRTVKLMVVK